MRAVEKACGLRWHIDTLLSKTMCCSCLSADCARNLSCQFPQHAHPNYLFCL